MSEMKKLLFYRDYMGFTGGHLKVWDYYNHTKLSKHYRPSIYFSERSIWENNPWRNERGGIEAAWQPENADILFLAGLDWNALPENWEKMRPQIPVINLIQHVRHAKTDDPRYPFLNRPAIRITVSKQVTDAITNTGSVSGPVYTIENCLDFHNFPVVKDYHKRTYDIVIFGLKQPELAVTLFKRLERQELNIKVINRPMARREYLNLLNDTKIAVMLPNIEEGFYLPALEGMRLGTFVICPDCIGNRGFCHDTVNCLMPMNDQESFVRATEIALNLAEDDSKRIRDEAYQTALKHDLKRERNQFLEILSQADEIWNDML